MLRYFITPWDFPVTISIIAKIVIEFGYFISVCFVLTVKRLIVKDDAISSCSVTLIALSLGKLIQLSVICDRMITLSCLCEKFSF